MNKRQSKKKINNISKFVQLEDVSNKCLKCQNYEFGDSSVGLDSGCLADFLFDNDGNFIEKNNDIAINYLDKKGYSCPYFKKDLTKTKQNDNLPKTYREYKSRKRIQEDYFKRISFFG